MTIHQNFANNAVEIFKEDESITGLAVGGSWLTSEIDEFSDLDLILIPTRHTTVEEKVWEYFQYIRNFGEK